MAKTKGVGGAYVFVKAVTKELAEGVDGVEHNQRHLGAQVGFLQWKSDGGMKWEGEEDDEKHGKCTGQPTVIIIDTHGPVDPTSLWVSGSILRNWFFFIDLLKSDR